MRTLAILGATGSIGRQTLDVVRAHPGRLRVAAVTAHRNADALSAVIREFQPKYAAVGSEEEARRLRASFPSLQVGIGAAGLLEAASFPGVDLVVSALVGAVGIEPALAALKAGRDVALANKETLVSAGSVVMAAARAANRAVIPVDSEHSALAQCIRGYREEDVERMILTASGGPFLRKTPAELARVTAVDALKHPTWNMGQKVSIDSSTLMNKGLEVIEAHFLFSLPYDQIDVLIHPQSVIHSLVEFKDGAMLAQLGSPDMRMPIQYALLGERAAAPWQRLDLVKMRELAFANPDALQFPALGLAYDCGRAGGTYPAVMNAANEESVLRFLEGELDYLGIVDTVRRVVDGHRGSSEPSLEAIFEADAWARRAARAAIRERSRVT